jgi:hypothetical protein
LIRLLKTGKIPIKSFALWLIAILRLNSNKKSKCLYQTKNPLSSQHEKFKSKDGGCLLLYEECNQQGYFLNRSRSKIDYHNSLAE